MKPVGYTYVSRAIEPQRVETREAGWRLPSYALIVMIVVTAVALSAATAIRAREQARQAEASYLQTAERVQQARTENARLREQIERFRSQPRAAEQVAREHQPYVRPNEIVVKVR